MPTQQPNDSDRREKLRRIVTRNGMSGRIPELLEAELDALEVLIQDETLKARISEAQSWRCDQNRIHVDKHILKLESQLNQPNTNKETK